MSREWAEGAVGKQAWAVCGDPYWENCTEGSLGVWTETASLAFSPNKT